MGNQNSSGNQGPGQSNNEPRDSIRRPAEGIDFPDLTTKLKSPKMSKKKNSPKKKNRSMTPTKTKSSSKGVSFNDLVEPNPKTIDMNRALTPLRQITGRKESDPGLDTLAIGLIRSQVNFLSIYFLFVLQ